MMPVVGMLTCRWAAKWIQRYLDADPSALLSAREVRRLESHLSTCERCAADAEGYRMLRRTLSGWTDVRTPAPEMVARVRLNAQRAIAGEHD